MGAKKIFCAFAFYLISDTVMAQGLILNDENIRADLNWLNQQGVIQISTSTWPLTTDEVSSALTRAQIDHPSQQKVVDALWRALEQQAVKLKLSSASQHKTIPQSFAEQQFAQHFAALSVKLGQQHWDARLNLNIEDDLYVQNRQHYNVAGSYLAAKLWNQWLIAGQIESYWGPGHEGSLIRGDATRPVYGITAQRAEHQAFTHPWLSWIGPWQYQLFAGQLDDYQAVPHAKLLGLRVTMQPWPYLELGASRTLQWGGEGRSESASSLWNAIKGNDNFTDGSQDKSNQIAGFDARLNLQQWTQQPLSIYGQYVGEDEAGLLPSKKMYLFGVDYSASYKNLPYQLYAEWANTCSNGKVLGVSYNHYIYQDGYYQHGAPLGHAMGGDSEMYALGGNIRFDQVNRLSARLLYAKLNQSQLALYAAFPQQEKITAVDLTWTHQLLPNMPLKLNAWLSDSDRLGQDQGISVQVEIPLEKKIFNGRF